MAYGAALSGMGVSLVTLFVALARAAERRVAEFNAQELRDIPSAIKMYAFS